MRNLEPQRCLINRVMLHVSRVTVTSESRTLYCATLASQDIPLFQLCLEIGPRSHPNKSRFSVNTSRSCLHSVTRPLANHYFNHKQTIWRDKSSLIARLCGPRWVKKFCLTPVETIESIILSLRASVSPCFILMRFLSRHFMAYILPVSAFRHPYTSPKPPRPMIRCTLKSFIVSCGEKKVISNGRGVWMGRI